MYWTEERVALLRKLWAEGLSASQIAKQLGGVTRNAVIGKVHRLGMAGRATPSRPAKRPVRVRAAPSLPRLLTQAGVYVISNETIGDREVAIVASISEHEKAIARSEELAPLMVGGGAAVLVHRLNDSTCKFPVGDPRDSAFGFCGRGTVGASCYCADHAKLCNPPVKRRVRRRYDPASGRDPRLAQALKAAGY